MSDLSANNLMAQVRVSSGPTESSQKLDMLPEIDPYSAEYIADPLATIARVRAISPLARSSRGLEVLTYDACCEVYLNENYESALPEIVAGMGINYSELLGPGRNLVNSEGDDHKLMRRVVSKWFTPRRVKELRPAVDELIGQLLAPITARGGGDFSLEVADKIPAQVFCWMMGAPVSRADELFEVSSTLLGALNGDPDSKDACEDAFQRMNAFVDDLVAMKREKPADDLMSILVAAADEGVIGTQDLYTSAQELLSASSDTSALAACRVIGQLASRPSDWARLRASPELIPAAMEECQRYDTILEVDFHVSHVPSVIQGIEIPAGMIAVVGLLAANHDPSVFEEPEKFDIDRQFSRPQLGFGRGRHFCIGAALARMELEAIVSAMVREYESVELAGVPPGPLRQGAMVRPLPIKVNVG